MAPEQAQAKGIGPWTDLYAVGVMAFEMLTGRVPFDDPDEPWAVLMRHINEPLPPPLALNPALDAGIAAWLERMLAKDPAQRPASAREAWDQLDDHVVRAAGPFWRREARLDERLDGEHDEAHSRPLSEAEFPSAADLASSAQSGYLTFSEPPARTPTPPAPPPPPLPISSAVVTGGQVTAPPGTPEPAPVAPPARRRRRWVVAVVAAVALVGGSAAAGITALTPDGSTPSQPLLSMKSVEAAVRDSLPANDVRAVRCPPGTPRQPGLTVECRAALDGGGEMAVTIQQTADGVTAHPHL
jgi:hypothetical protein